MIKFTLNQLILSGVHIGHSFKNTLLFASWMLFSFRQHMWFINLYLTLYMFKLAFKILKTIVNKHGPIWFINLDKSTERFVRFVGNRCGEFFCSLVWIHGLLSNFVQISNSYQRFVSKPFFIRSKKENLFGFTYENWFLTRFSWPRSVFVFSVFNSKFVIKEAICSDIPCIGIVDTNVKSQGVTVAIPGNDDSLDSLIFYSEIISSFILFSKFKWILFWFSYTRDNKKLLNFEGWLYKIYTDNKNYSNSLKIKLDNHLSFLYLFSINYSNLFLNSFDLFFGQGFWQKGKFDYFNVNIYPFKLFSISDKKYCLFFSHKFEKLMSIYKLYFFKYFLKRKAFLKNKRRHKFFSKRIQGKFGRRFYGLNYFLYGGFLSKYMSKKWVKLFDSNIKFKRFLCHFFSLFVKKYKSINVYKYKRKFRNFKQPDSFFYNVPLFYRYPLYLITPTLKRLFYSIFTTLWLKVLFKGYYKIKNFNFLFYNKDFVFKYFKKVKKKKTTITALY